MTWRPWVVAVALIGALLLDLVLVVQERLPPSVGAQEVDEVEEVLRHLQYQATTRRSNFVEMGMDDDLADKTAKYVDRYARKQDLFRKLLSEQAGEVGQAFCPGNGLPQPYAAMKYLVYEENERRDAIDPERLREFEAQPWFDAAPVNAVYRKIELAEGRKKDATIMGVAAILVRKEDDALDTVSPWGAGMFGTWGWSAVQSEYPASEMKVIQYFSLMHYLTELANTRDGICS